MHHTVVQGGPQRKNKILVHCHAGQGRTAIIIGAYLLFSQLAEDADDCIKKARAGRPKLFNKKYNRAYMYEFEKYLKTVRCLYATAAKRMSLQALLKR